MHREFYVVVALLASCRTPHPPLTTYIAVPGSRACPNIALDRYLIIKPSASDRIHGPNENGAGSEASFDRSDRVKTLTDREESVF